MNLRSLIFFLLIFFCLSTSYSYFCYQESTNQSNINDGSCTLNYSGSYSCDTGVDSCSAGIDENWATVHPLTDNTGTKYIYINYSKPEDSTNNSKLLFSITEAGGGFTPQNITLPQACWEQNPDKLVFQVAFTWTGCIGFCYQNFFQCYNGTSWINLNTGRDGGLYEEAMWWDIEEITEIQQSLSSIFPYQGFLSILIAVLGIIYFLF